MDGDRNRCFVQETAVLARTGTGFLMDYHMTSPMENRELDDPAVERAVTIFNTTKKSFTPEMVKCPTIG